MAHARHSAEVSLFKRTRRTDPALPPDCSVQLRVDSSVDTPVFRGHKTAIGAFRCPSDHPSFRDSGPTSDFLVVFPRTSVWIRHEGSQAFLADPNVVTIYNRAQRYERRPQSPDGDRCDWFAVSGAVAREIAGTFEPVAGESERPFRFQWSRSTPALYLRQRTLMRRVERGEADALETEQEVMGIVASVLALAHGQTPRAMGRRTSSIRRHRELADAARTELMRAPQLNRSVHDLALAIGTSPYHLCRVFLACTGKTLHQYRLELRTRHALELLEGAAVTPPTLSALAHQLGFASHSHFVLAMRRQFGATPSVVRKALRQGDAVGEEGRIRPETQRLV